ncbi:polysaccharide deacetylase family protein [Micromonospora rubida]|uniref:polysaccharide deacetylase family protein n=1 Tax=Micromonospora rubida TaxID=2697657 RepID=UPI001376AC03|nr:polysaccharide deacetylase family protein [Micromonospora rubida]NBE81035.1 polysaccharide deacetylase family protein [Micromonospora rubida]
MAPTAGGRFVGFAAVVVAVLLGSAFALGQKMAPEPRPHPTGVARNADEPPYADQPPGAAPTSPTAGPTAGPTVGGQNGATGQPTETAGDGLFGARVDTGSAEVALTFDDGPNPQYTPQVLALLREYGVKATFCVVGENAWNHPDLIQAIVADGHTLCNHSWQHDVLLGKRSPDVIRADLLRTNAAIRDAVPDAPIGYFRQPGGAWTYPVVSAAEEIGMIPLHWTVDPSDWKAPGAAKISAVVSADVHPGAVVLLHDAGGDRQGTVDALHSILPKLTGRFRLEALPIPAGTA